MKLLRQLIRLEITLIFLVILAGSVVRMTGSGMGCPDWPKCFGHLIPPTRESEVLWKPNFQYEKGQIIVHEKQLLVAKEKFKSSGNFKKEDFAPYTKHDYAIFNAYHTWIEYLNRLLGALSGLPMLIIFIICLFRIRKDIWSFVLAALGLFLLGFVAWLGKLVVDGNLIPHQISLHMFGAMGILATLMALLIKNQSRAILKREVRFAFLMPVLLILLLVQIFWGTEVREEIDGLYKHFSGEQRELWVGLLGQSFIIHRSISWAVLALSLLFFLLNRRTLGFKAIWPLVFTFVSMLIGIGLAYKDMPKTLQPIHLVWAQIFFAWLFYFNLRIFGRRRKSF